MSFILLPNRGFIGLFGSEVKSFLNNITTKDVLSLTRDKPIYCLMLNSQGRYMYDFFLIEKENYILLECNSDDVISIIEQFKFYRLHLKIKIKNLSKYYQAGVFLRTLNYNLKDNNQAIFNDPRCDKLGTRGIFSKEEKFLCESIVSYDEYEKLRIENIVPDSSKDMLRGYSFPLHYRLDKLNGIDLNKGCYTGQEVVARMYRMTPKKMIYLVKNVFNEALPYQKKVIMNNQEEIGLSLSSYSGFGLCLLNVEKANYAIKNNSHLHIEGNDIIIVN